MPGRLLVVLALLLALAASGCDGDDDEPESTATRTATTQEEDTATATESITTVTPTPTPTGSMPTASIRDVDPSQLPEVQRLLNESFGQLDPASVIYADLTGDGGEEAIIPISSGGTAGNVAYVVYGYRDGQLTPLLTRQGVNGIVLEVDGSALVERLPDYGPDDPNCCPSQFRVRRYQWNGTALAVVDEQVVPGETSG